ncbi:MAG: UTP--glucose-1-phosphate uridylyltransferase, partial [Alphaproteobacteria bacterium]|nr:UTP--glucose-1-phosphate uridylyltransferase [Alphaproteobacteria bacterium]
RDAGIEEFIFVTGRYKNMLEEHFDYQPELEETLIERNKNDVLTAVRNSEITAGKLFLTRQPKPLGLGHAVWCAHKLVGNEPFAIILPDDIVNHETGCLAQMIQAYNEHGGNIVAVKEVPREETMKYGILDIEKDNGDIVSVKGLVEKPEPKNAPSTLSVIGRYILQPEVFTHLSVFERGAGNEIQLTDAIAKLIGNQPLHGLRFKGDHFDCGSRLGFIAANLAYGLKDPKVSDGIRTILKQINS